jgi:hypothetical protein
LGASLAMGLLETRLFGRSASRLDALLRPTRDAEASDHDIDRIRWRQRSSLTAGHTRPWLWRVAATAAEVAEGVEDRS